MYEPGRIRRSATQPKDEVRPPIGRLWSRAAAGGLRRRREDEDAPTPALLVLDRELDSAGSRSVDVEAFPPATDHPPSLTVVGDAPEPEPRAVPAVRARERWRLLRSGLMLADGLAALTGALVAEIALTMNGTAVVPLVAAAVVGWWAVGCALGLYTGDDVRTWGSGVSHAPRIIVTALLLSWPLYFVASAMALADPAAIAIVIAGTAIVCTGAARGIVRAMLHQGTHLRQRTLIIGSGTIAGELVHQLRSQTHFGLDPIGFVDDEPHMPAGNYVPYCGGLEDLPDVLDTHSVDRVIIAFTRASHEDLLRCIRTCRDRRVATDIVPRLFELLDGADGMAHIGGLPLISITVPGLSRSAAAVKRLVDVVLTAVLALVLLPLLACVALAIKLETRGPVLFRQTRAGRGGNNFHVLKFRSMYEDAEARKRELDELNDASDGVMFKIHEDPRITRVGKVLRRYSLDELPQLFNVLRGDMSLVGPRPLILDESDVLLEDWHMRRLDLRPGITGPWQVRGRSDLTVRDMVRFDYTYVSGWTLARDFEILLATVPAVLSGRGAY